MMHTNESAAGTVTTNPLSTMIILAMAITVVIGSGSYFSSKTKGLEPTTQKAPGLIEMLFPAR